VSGILRVTIVLAGEATAEEARAALLAHDCRARSEVESTIWRELTDEGLRLEDVALELERPPA
jgi:hypothetical protein